MLRTRRAEAARTGAGNVARPLFAAFITLAFCACPTRANSRDGLGRGHQRRTRHGCRPAVLPASRRRPQPPVRTPAQHLPLRLDLSIGPSHLATTARGAPSARGIRTSAPRPSASSAGVGARPRRPSSSRAWPSSGTSRRAGSSTRLPGRRGRGNSPRRRRRGLCSRSSPPTRRRRRVVRRRGRRTC